MAPPRRELTFRPADPTQEPAAGLLAAMAEELNRVYGSSERLRRPALQPEEMTPPGGLYLVGWLEGHPIAGGGVRRLGNGIGEIKRMYVLPARRGTGVATALLGALEDAAVTLGYRTVRLDTGCRQPDAVHLYESSGYAPVPPYNDNPFACFWGEKDLRRHRACRSG